MGSHVLSFVRYGLYGYLLLIPVALPLISGPSPHDTSRMAQLLIAALCSVVVLTSWLGFSHWRPQKFLHMDRFAQLGLLILGVGLVGSVVNAHRPEWAFRELALWGGLIAVALMLALDSQRTLRELPWVLTLSALLYIALLSVLAMIVLWSKGALPTPDVMVVGYNNYRFLNHTQTVLLPLLIGVAVASPEARLRRISALTACLHWFWLWQFGGRATLLAMGVSALVLMVLFRRHAWPHVRTQAICSTLAFVLLSLGSLAVRHTQPADSPLTAVARAGSLTDDGARFYLWKKAWEQFEGKPWIGVGPMHFADFEQHPNLKAAHPHNLYLQWLAEFGLPFTLAALYLFIRAMSSIRRHIQVAIQTGSTNDKGYDPQIGLAIMAAMVAVAVDSGFSGNLVMPVSQVWIAVAVGWCLAWLKCQERPHCSLMRSRVPMPWLLIATLICALAVWVCALASLDFLRLQEYLDAAMDRVKTPKSHPRFWSHGWF